MFIDLLFAIAFHMNMFDNFAIVEQIHSFNHRQAIVHHRFIYGFDFDHFVHFVKMFQLFLVRTRTRPIQIQTLKPEL